MGFKGRNGHTHINHTGHFLFSVLANHRGDRAVIHLPCLSKEEDLGTRVYNGLSARIYSPRTETIGGALVNGVFKTCTNFLAAMVFAVGQRSSGPLSSAG